MGQLTPKCSGNMALVECIYHMNNLSFSPTFLKYKVTYLIGRGIINTQNFRHG
jgi:hypothetical protein